jgi:5,10-methylenetetrahydrofolate reductase
MQLKRKLEAGEFVVLAEMEPPKGIDVEKMTADALRVKERVDAFLIPEMSNAVMRMSALGGAMILRKKGMEAVMQICCRDRNRIALQADLLAAAAMGIDVVMAVTGEDPRFGDHHDAKPVYDIDLPSLLLAVRGLSRGRDMAGVEISGNPSFVVFSTVNIGAMGEALEVELNEMKRKIDAGVRYFVSPYLFDPEAAAPFLSRAEAMKNRILPTVVLLKSVGMARYMDKNLPHVHVPETMIERIQKAGDKQRACLEIARETVAAVRKAGFCGVVLASLGWEHKLPEVLGKG